MNRKMQGKRLTTMLAAGLLTMAAASSAYASYPISGLIAEWDTYLMSGTEVSLAGTSSVAQISGLTLSRGTGLTASGATNNMGSTGWSGTYADDYFQFSLTVADGYKATLYDLWIGARSSKTGPGTIGFYSSTDNYANAFYSMTMASDGSTYSNEVVDLSSLGSISGSFFIRLYEIDNTQADGSGDTASTGTFRVGDYYDGATFGNIGITGTVAPVSAVPVPAAAWLLGSGLLGLVGLKRKRQ